jgi:transposase
MKLLYRPLGLLASNLGGLAAGALFKSSWKRMANEEEPPEATPAEKSWKEIVPAAALQGAVFGAVKVGVDRGAQGLREADRRLGRRLTPQLVEANARSAARSTRNEGAPGNRKPLLTSPYGGRARVGPRPSPPSLLSPVLLRSGCQYELGKEDPGMSVYVGIDVHRKRSQIAVVDESGEVQVNRNVANGVEPVLSVLGGVPRGTAVAFEAAYGWGWLVELLDDYGFEPHLVHPSRCKAIAAARLKNDKVDAATLAQLLRADLLPEAWIAPPAIRQLRALLRHRAQLVRVRAMLRNRIHAVLADHGHQRPQGCWSRPGRAWLASLDLPIVSRQVIDDDLAMADALEDPITALDKDIHERAKGDPRIQVLTALPGVGELTAMIILAEIGDINRFGSARKLASWAGLTPTVRGSDRTVRHGHISKQGSAWLRWVLCEAAQTAKRHPDFAESYTAISHRRGKKIATTAIARKLLCRAYHLLNEAPTETATNRRRSCAERPAAGAAPPTLG